jgi:hypothetical protein
MQIRMVVAALVVAGAACTISARADERADQQRDCTGDAMNFCSQFIFAPDRDLRIGSCLWEHRAQISPACRTHLHPPPRRSAPR